MNEHKRTFLASSTLLVPQCFSPPNMSAAINQALAHWEQAVLWPDLTRSIRVTQADVFRHSRGYLGVQGDEWDAGLPYLEGMPESFEACADVTFVIGDRQLVPPSPLLVSEF